MFLILSIVLFGVALPFGISFAIYSNNQNNYARAKRDAEYYKQPFEFKEPVFNKTLPAVASVLISGVFTVLGCITVVPAYHSSR